MSFLFEPKFPTGRVVITPGASDLLAENEQNPLEFIERHTNGDWGSVSTDDWLANDQALIDGTRLFSVYPIPDDEGEYKIWLITEADRSVTTILLPSDY